ncbi:ribosomal protein L11 methyltransferase [Pseudomonas chlororaphis subsp. aurantiaca]|nr:ribosomal protein L11 methyltransferase [Pseudomonas chlororaphis subsp. aurantiaca]
MSTCVGGKYQATKGGEGCGFFGHRQSSWEDKDWSKHMACAIDREAPLRQGQRYWTDRAYKAAPAQLEKGRAV